jgi:CRP-like cAMP-binding protein
MAPESLSPPSVLGIPLGEVRGLEDLPEDSQRGLARSVEIHVLDAEEEVTGFGLALVLEGRIAVMPAVMDVVCVQAGRGELIFAEGHIGDGVALKVVAAEDNTRVAAWPIEQFAEAIAPCPWVRDELRRVGDKLQAMVGAAMGPMGEKLDEQLRAMVLDRCSVKLLLPGEAVAEAGKPIAGMTIVGAGRLALFDKAGQEIPDAELGPGDFVFPSEMLSAAKAPASVRAAESGALVVFADRKTAHELLMSVPPLIEVLSE